MTVIDSKDFIISCIGVRHTEKTFMIIIGCNGFMNDTLQSYE